MCEWGSGAFRVKSLLGFWLSSTKLSVLAARWHLFPSGSTLAWLRLHGCSRITIGRPRRGAWVVK